MTLIELLKKRQSVRKYISKPVSGETLERCLEAARLSPSACNSQPWSFIVIDEEKMKNELADKAFSGIYSMNSFAKTAPVLIVVITEHVTYASRLGGYFRGTPYSRIDIGMACENLILQAAEEGLGTCLLGWFNEKAVKKFLGLPENTKIDIIVSVGYPESDEVRKKKRKPLGSIAKFNPKKNL